MASSLRLATSLRSSRRTTAKVEAVNPCLRAFCAERVLPSGERGPVALAALARLAASRSGDTVFWEFGMRLSFRFQSWHGEGVESECGRGQVTGKKGVNFWKCEERRGAVFLASIQGPWRNGSNGAGNRMR